MFDAIIIGSGPAGTAAAYALRGKKVLMLDVGYAAPAFEPAGGNLYACRKSGADLFGLLIGERFESLHNLHQRTVSLKLKSPLMSYIIRDWERLCPLRSQTFEPVMSFARGGLANGWGAGVYRFTEAELAEYPIKLSDLNPYYDKVRDLIGISGTNDDLATSFGRDDNLLPPLKLTRFASILLERYQLRNAELRSKGLLLGYPRLAVLTREYAGRPAYRYDNLEFFQPYNRSIYNPIYTLDSLIAAGQVDYRSPYLAKTFSETGKGVRVTARHLGSGFDETFEGRKLLLAAGTLGTSKIVLESRGDRSTRLPILDNPMSTIPLFRPSLIGSALDVNDTSLAQLNLVYRDGGSTEPVQGTLYGATGPLRSDIVFDLPLPLSASITFVRNLAPAMGLLLLFHPDTRKSDNHLRIAEDGAIEVHYESPRLGQSECKLIRLLAGLGVLGHTSLCQYPKIGSSLHYAGTLPMKERPGDYETDSAGRLASTRNVHVVDGACLTTLPAKNLTYTIMANAMRISEMLLAELG